MDDPAVRDEPLLHRVGQVAKDEIWEPFVLFVWRWARSLLTPVQTLTQCLDGHRQTMRSYTIETNQKSISSRIVLTLLSVWHIFGCWLATAVFIILGANLLLSWYIDWYRQSGRLTSESHNTASAMVLYSAIFFRAWMLINLNAELARFAVVFACDSWRKDAFVFYRQALIGYLLQHWKERDEQRLERRVSEMPLNLFRLRFPDVPDWNTAYLETYIFGLKRTYWDYILQVVLYGSLDAVPVAKAFLEYISSGSVSRAVYQACNCLCSVTICHVCFLFFAWWLTDVVLKVRVFRAWKWPQEADDPPRPQNDAVHGSQLGAGLDEPPDAAAIEPGAAIPAARDDRGTADKQNLCVLLCGFLAGCSKMLPSSITMIVLFCIAILIKRGWIIALGVGCLLLGHACKGVCKRCAGNPNSNHTWGETYCGLPKQGRAPRTNTIMVLVLTQAVLFAYFKLWFGFGMCLAGLFVLVLERILAYLSGPWTWCIAVAGRLVINILVLFVNFLYSWTWGLFCFFAIIFRQAGLARYNKQADGIKRVFRVVLVVVMLVVVAVVGYTASDSEESSWSAMCNARSQDNCHYRSIPVVGTLSKSRSGTLCQASFPLGSSNSPRLHISDFAMFSALAYEKENLRSALQHYFPGWELRYSHYPNMSERSRDWTTFFEFSDPDNTTTIFSVRGTYSALDILDDINVWTPAVLLQVFAAFGPEFPSGVAASVSHFSSAFGGFQKSYFCDLYHKVIASVNAAPNRTFYITGHSLGGGLAKLVARNANISSITFMSPGLRVTERVVYGSHKYGTGSDASYLTVRPTDDIVSKVDDQMGVTIPTPCHKGMTFCHKMYPAICTILDSCGSGREGELPWTSLTRPNIDTNGNDLCNPVLR